ncbi:MAG: phosphoribosylglycinamide formyltransferase [Phycisphaerales bacterium]|nr:phosphoribosylglycinamide formyltransferase [Phycisphaerales bacterium]
MASSHRFKTALLVSGGGTTALNLIGCEERGEIPTEIAVIIAHRLDIPAVARCEAAGRPVLVLSGPPSLALSDHIDEALRVRGVELVLLAGYLRAFRVGAWVGRVLNIHPALLPAFGGQGMYGRRVHDAVIASGAEESGCTVHMVDDQYDHGATLIQRRVNIQPDDSAQTLAERVFDQECIAYPEAIRKWASTHS